MFCDCDYEKPAFYLKTYRKARKEHRCDECRNFITPGESYEIVSAMWDAGKIDTYKTCQRCLSVRNYVYENIPCFCWNHQSLLDDAAEALREYRHELPGLLFGGLRLIKQSIRRTIC